MKVIDDSKGRKWKAFLVTMAIGILVQALDMFGFQITPEQKAQIMDFLLKLLGVYTVGNLLTKFAPNGKEKGGEI